MSGQKSSKSRVISIILAYFTLCKQIGRAGYISTDSELTETICIPSSVRTILTGLFFHKKVSEQVTADQKFSKSPMDPVRAELPSVLA